MGRTQTWRVSTAGRIAGGVFAGLFGVGAVAAVVVGLIDGHVGTIAASFGLAVAFAGVSAAGYLGGVRPSISVDDEYLRVRNPLRDYVVALGEIERVVPGYYGLTIRRRGGGGVCAWAVQKSNLATADDRQVRADRIAAEIAERAAAAGGRKAAAAVTLSASERVTLSASTRRAMAWALAAIVAVTAARILVGG